LTWGRLGYMINFQKFTLLDILHGMLRGNRKASKRKIKYIMSKHDPRAQYITKFDPRIHFAVLSGVMDFPVVGIFNPKTLDAELKQATESFLQEAIDFNKPKKEIIIPKMFHWYNKDFGKNEFSVLKWISEQLLPSQKKEDLDAFLSKGKFNLRYNKYDFEISDTGTSITDSVEISYSDMSSEETSPTVSENSETSPETKRQNK